MQHQFLLPQHTDRPKTQIPTIFPLLQVVQDELSAFGNRRLVVDRLYFVKQIACWCSQLQPSTIGLFGE